MIDISLDDALKYLERVIDTRGQNSEDHFEIHDQTACRIADLLRDIVYERDEARAEIERMRGALREIELTHYDAAPKARAALALLDKPLSVVTSTEQKES
jgi:hypothetical protein